MKTVHSVIKLVFNPLSLRKGLLENLTRIKQSFITIQKIVIVPTIASLKFAQNSVRPI